jgi:hypothetical protein
MKESYGEGVAIHTDPESCAGACEGSGEALTGARAGRVLSREILLKSRVPTLWDRWKATPGVSLSRDTSGPCAVGDLEHVRKHFAREPGDPVSTFGVRALEGALGSPRT